MKQSRRSFIRQLAFDAAGGSNQTLVCIFLRGGADTLNMLVPYGDDRYYAIRPSLAIRPPSNISADAEAAIRLDEFYGLHPRLLPLLPLYLEGRLGFVQGVGSDNPTGSHFESQDQMERGETYGKTIGSGWIARHLRSRRGRETTPLSSIAIGSTIPESLRGAPVASVFESIDELQLRVAPGRSEAVAGTLAALYGSESGPLSVSGRSTIELLNKVDLMRTTSRNSDSANIYPDDEFGAGLREIARLIEADVGLEIACIDLGGWDTHFFQGTVSGFQAESIDILGRGIAAFDSDLGVRRENVTTVVMTEFGRRVYENGSMGTDHGRGFAMFATGSQVAGGRVYGGWPGLEDDQYSLGPGGLAINFDYRSVLSEILIRVLGNTRVDLVFPGFQPETVALVTNGK